MGGRAEQLPRFQTKSSWRKTKRFIKRTTGKTARRLGKKHLEDAPKSVIRGWSD